MGAGVGQVNRFGVIVAARGQVDVAVEAVGLDEGLRDGTIGSAAHAAAVDDRVDGGEHTVQQHIVVLLALFID